VDLSASREGGHAHCTCGTQISPSFPGRHADPPCCCLRAIPSCAPQVLLLWHLQLWHGHPTAPFHPCCCCLGAVPSCAPLVPLRWHLHPWPACPTCEGSTASQRVEVTRVVIQSHCHMLISHTAACNRVCGFRVTSFSLHPKSI